MKKTRKEVEAADVDVGGGAPFTYAQTPDPYAGGSTAANTGSPGYNQGPGATVTPADGPTLSSSPAVDIADTNPLYTAGGQFLQRGQAGSQQAQQQALQAAQNLYQGKGPSLATQLLQNQSNQTQAQNNAMASSASGSQSALARRQAMMANTQAQTALGQQAGVARAQEQLGALGQMGQLAGQSRAQDMALVGGQEGLVANQAGMNLQDAGIQRGVQVQNNQAAQNYAGAAASFTGAMFADMPGNVSGEAAGLSLKEPGGSSHWIIREEPNFLLAANARTGELRKILTAPLTPDEHHQAMKPHGAGPIGSQNRDNLYVNKDGMQHGADVNMGSQAGNAIGNQPSHLGGRVSNGAKQGGANMSPSTPNQPTAVSRGLTSAGDKLSQPGPAVNFAPGNVNFASNPGDMGDAAAKAVARGGDVNMGSSPGQDPAQQFRQNYIDASAKSETEAGDVTFGGQPDAPPPQTGADRAIAMMNRDPNAGYSVANLKKTAAPIGPGNRPDYGKVGLQDLSFMAKKDQASGAYPKGDVDLGSYRASLQHESDQEKYSAGGKPDYMPDYKGRDVGGDDSIDFGISDPRNLKNLDRGGTDVDESGEPTQMLPEERIAPTPKPTEKVKFRGKQYEATSADTHLGGKFRVNPPKPASTLPKTGGGLRGLTSFYSKPKLDSVPKGGSMLGKAMMSSSRKKAV